MAKKKIYPTLWYLYRDKLLPKKVLIVGYARSDLTIEKIKASCSPFTKLDTNNSEEARDWEEFWKHNVYLKGSYDKGEDYDRLDALISTAETESSSRSGTPVSGTRSPDLKSSSSSASGRTVDKGMVAMEGQKHGNRLFYLALPPTAFESCSSMIREHCMPIKGWIRVIIEKPFGHDLDSSEKLSRHLSSLFHEDQIYRIDHYLGKEMVQNVMTLR